MGTILFIVPNINVGIAGRFICGISVGLNSVIVPLYVREISPKQISGMMGSFNQGFINVGNILSAFFGLFFPTSVYE